MIRSLHIAILALSLGLVLTACQDVSLPPAAPAPGSVATVPAEATTGGATESITETVTVTGTVTDTESIGETPAPVEEPAATAGITPTLALQTPSAPEAVPTATPLATAAPAEEAAEGAAVDAPDAIVAAQQGLAEQLELDVAEVTVVAYEWMEWPDACLGAAQPDEMCATVITPGYQVMLEAAGQPYQVHTNDDGSVWRLVQRRAR